jgi:hypothetical protein
MIAISLSIGLDGTSRLDSDERVRHVGEAAKMPLKDTLAADKSRALPLSN